MEWATAKQSQSAATTAPMSLIRLPGVCKATGLGRSMIYQLEATQRFPRRIRIGVRAVGWLEAEVQQWIAERVKAHRA